VDAELDYKGSNFSYIIVSRFLAELPVGFRDPITRKVDELDELVSEFGLQTRLVLLERLERANSIVLIFVCLTLSAVESLRDQWRSQKLRCTVESLFTLLCKLEGRSRRMRLPLIGSICVKRLTWRLADYERCVEFFRSPKGNSAENWLSLDMHYARFFLLSYLNCKLIIITINFVFE